jgi:hypothetical protein
VVWFLVPVSGATGETENKDIKAENPISAQGVASMDSRFKPDKEKGKHRHKIKLNITFRRFLLSITQQRSFVKI